MVFCIIKHREIIKKMQKQRKLSGSMQQDYLPLYFRGEPQLFKYMDLKFEATINLQKQHIFSLPLKTFNIDKEGFIEPLAQIETFDDISRQNLLKNKSLIKDGIFYVYFPSNIRVDEKIFKIYEKNYEGFVKDVPKNFRINFARFVVWEEGTGQHSIQFQKQKIQQGLSNCIKLAIQKKLEEFTKQISTFQSLQMNPRVLRSLFVSRNKVASIYKQLKLTTIACEHYSSLFNEILLNFKKFQAPGSAKELSVQKTQYKSPFVVKDINKVFAMFESRNYLLQITNFCFSKMLQSHLDAVQPYEAMKRFKQYIEFVVSNILNVVASRQDDVAKNIWIIQTIDEGYKLMRQKPPATIQNPQREEEYSLMRVSICSQYRNAIQRIGVIFYGLNTYIVFPRNLEYELTLCIKSMHGQPLTQTEYPEMKILNRHHEVNKMLFLSGEPITDTIEALLNNFESYKHLYVRTLELMEKTLSESPYKKVSWSMKLSVLKATIIYFTLKDEKRTSIASLLEENTNFSYDSKKSVWQKLEIINKVYQLTLCHRYSIKMRVEDLLNIILDDSIIHLQKMWMELVKIVSKLLFEYKKGETEEEAERLNTIEYGEGEEQEQGVVNRKKRRTTIHYDERKIEVGTIKFISLVDCVDPSDEENDVQSSEKGSQNRHNSIRLNVELSNRIISYALALISKSKAQRVVQPQYENQNQNPLISLKFIIKTAKNQSKIIPFEIIQTEDKFMQVQIQSSQVMIFTVEKLLIDISDSITLVYTMPINHDKIQFYDKKLTQSELQEDYYLNISPQLKINTLTLFSPCQQFKNPESHSQSHYRKESTSSISSRPNSQASASHSTHLLYHSLWTPLKLNFAFTPNDQLEIQKLQIHCQDQIHHKVFLGEKTLNYKQFSDYKVSSSEESSIFPLIIFVKPSQRQQINKEPSTYLSASKANKDSINIIPKSLRNRAQSFSRSMTSAPSNISIDSNKVSIKLHLKHNGYSYQVSKQLSYSKRTPFKVDYRYSQEFEEYTIKSMTDQELQILSEDSSFELFPFEELKVFSPMVRICLKYQEQGIESDSETQQPSNLMRVMKLEEKVDLKTMIKKEHLKPEKISTIWIELDQKFKDGEKEVYSIFQPIRIRAEECGYLSVLKWNSSEYELVGKVQGLIEYTNQPDGKYMNETESKEMKQVENRFLELLLIPTKKGPISLPEISINSKKGIWQNGKRIKVA